MFMLYMLTLRMRNGDLGELSQSVTNERASHKLSDSALQARKTRQYCLASTRMIDIAIFYLR